jgi:hypothetical protein
VDIAKVRRRRGKKKEQGLNDYGNKSIITEKLLTEKTVNQQTKGKGEGGVGGGRACHLLTRALELK